MLKTVFAAASIGFAALTFTAPSNAMPLPGAPAAASGLSQVRFHGGVHHSAGSIASVASTASTDSAAVSLWEAPSIITGQAVAPGYVIAHS
jgi:hypothetical protein